MPHFVLTSSFVSLALDSSLYVRNTARIASLLPLRRGFFCSSYSFSYLPSLLQQRLGLLPSWRGLACYFNPSFRVVPLYPFNRFPLLALLYFSIAKVGQASCCKGTLPHCLEKFSKILGCSCSFIQILCAAAG